MRLICTRCNYVFDTKKTNSFRGAQELSVLDTKEKKDLCPYCGEKNTLIEVQKAEELVPDGRK